MLFEGTGQGVEGRRTNVSRLRDLLVEDDAQRVHLESGPGTHFGAYLFGKLFGTDCRGILRSARRWFQRTGAERAATESLHVYLFGFSRGALLARYFAAWLDRLGVPVDYLGVWDTVDSTMKLDVTHEAPGGVRRARATRLRATRGAATSTSCPCCRRPVRRRPYARGSNSLSFRACTATWADSTTTTTAWRTRR